MAGTSRIGNDLITLKIVLKCSYSKTSFINKTISIDALLVWFQCTDTKYDQTVASGALLRECIIIKKKN